MVFCAFGMMLVPLVAPDSSRADEPIDRPLKYETDIRPIFRANCFDCHGATDEKEGELDLRQVRLMTKGGESGPAIVPGNSKESLLVDRIVSGEMPPGDHRVSEQDIRTIRQWIDQGATTARAEPEKIPRGLGITAEERSYWAFQPIHRPDVPAVKNVKQVKTPIDSFLLRKLESKGLAYSPDARKTELLRRASLDLIGLPPDPELLRDFLADQSPGAWDKVIDRLLDSPHYGERWGRHWLDVAGYADSEGDGNRDEVRTWSYKYRDWVIRALNQDMPFDQFIRWQLAGDELVEGPKKNMSPTEIDKLTATGFLRMAGDGTLRANSIENRNAVVRDTIEIVSSAFLGLSVKCAQCHDHRYDPISQEDYYRLRAVFEPALDPARWKTPPQRLVSLYTDEDHAKAAGIEKLAAAKTEERNRKLVEYMKEALDKVLAGKKEAIREPLREAYQTPANKRTPEQVALLKEHPDVKSFSPGVLYQYNQAHADHLKKMDAEIKAIRARKPVHEYVRGLVEPELDKKKPPVTRLFHRGDYRQPKYPVRPGALSICSPEESPIEFQENDPALPTTGRRLAYARWLTSGRHPLVARVLVNRIWMHHFGKGLVQTPGEFGKLGSKPTHPELLDWLADDFMSRGWSLKTLHRTILRSTVYRQSSSRNSRGNAADATNELYWHYPVHRLEAEAIRDSVLAVSGRLDREHRFGKPVTYRSDDTGQFVVEGDRQCRSVYLQVRRSQPVSILESFDSPDMQVNCTIRRPSTSSTQSLMLMNSRFIRDSAKAFAERIQNSGPIRLTARKFDPTVDQVAVQYRKTTDWRYGYGHLDQTTSSKGKTAIRFVPYPRLIKSTWQGSDKLPDPKIGWALLNAGGGHPDAVHGAAIRRWIAPVDGLVRIKGSITHRSPDGDGVVLYIVHSRLGILKTDKVRQRTVAYEVSTEVKIGDTLDTLVAAGGNHTSDSFGNEFEIQWLKNGKPARSWKTRDEFLESSRLLASRVPVSQRIIRAWVLAYGREPTEDEFRLASRFLVDQWAALKKRKTKDPIGESLVNLCQGILGSNGFLYID